MLAFDAEVSDLPVQVPDWSTEAFRDRHEKGVAAVSRWLVNPIYDGYFYGLRFPYCPAAKDIAKAKLNAMFHKGDDTLYKNYWLLPRTMLESAPGAVQEMLNAAGVKADPFALATYLAAKANLETQAFNTAVRVKMYQLDDGCSLVKFDGWYPPCRDYLKEGCKARWVEGVRAWKVSEDISLISIQLGLMNECSLNDVQIESVPGVFSLSKGGVGGGDGLIAKMNLGNVEAVHGQGVRLEEGESAFLTRHSSGIERTHLTEQQILEAIKNSHLKDVLAKHQQRGVVFMAARKGAANFGEQGTGKTRPTAAAASLVGLGKRKLIMAPVNLLLGWRDEINVIQPGAKISVGKYTEDAEWVILNPAKIPKATEHASKFAVLIVDEAHEIKNEGALRTQHIMDVASQIDVVYTLTGTPIPNREVELISLLKITRHPLGNLSRKEFRDRFTGSSEQRAILSDAIRDWHIRDLKARVLHLPPKQRNVIRIKPTRVFAKAYNALLESTDNPMAKRHKMMALLEDFKLKWSMRYVRGMPKHEKAIIFSEYLESVDEITEACKRSRIGSVAATGTRQKMEERYQAVVSFRENNRIRVYAGTIKSNNAGLNLQRGNHSIFLSLPWTAALLQQAEDRQHRLGQTSPVFVNIPVVEGAVDEAMIDILNYKAALSQEVLDREAAEDNQRKFEQLIKTARRI